MSETLFSLLMVIGAVGAFGLGWHLRGEHDKPTVTTQPPTSHVTRPSHHVSASTRALYKIEPPANLLEPINLQAANKRNRERILANMRAGKRNN